MSTSSFRFICELATGLHARPASLLSETVRRFHSAASVTNEQTGASGDARSVLSVIGLDVQQGHGVVVEAIGDDAAELLDAVRGLVARHFGETPGAAPAAQGAEFVVRVPEPLKRLGVAVVTGRPVCEGIGEGIAVLAGGLHIPETAKRAKGKSPEVERKRAGDAIAAVRVDIERELGAAQGVGAEVLRAHMGIVDDPALRHRIDALTTKGENALGAVCAVCREFAAKLGTSASAYIRERAADVEEVCRRVAAKIDPAALGESKVRLAGASVVVAPSLGVGQLMEMDREHLKGLVLGDVGATSHVVILARSLQIPTLIGVEAVGRIAAGAEVVVDAIGGFVVTGAKEGVRAYYQRDARARAERRRRIEPILRKRGATADGRGLEVAANAASPEEIAAAMRAGADAIGLLRTELLFLDRAEAPSEEEQYALYRGAVEAAGDGATAGAKNTDRSPGEDLRQSKGQHSKSPNATGDTRSVAREEREHNGREVIIRTLDIGGDKPAPYLKLPAEENPFLGCRGVRLYSKYPAIIRAQLRAVCRASAHGKVKVMAPMVATVGEARWFVEEVRKVQEELRAEGVAYNATMPVGIMVEVPSAAAVMDQIARVVDFVSVGTNDLCQYVMAADRGNKEVAGLNNARQPALLRVLDQIVKGARSGGRKCWVGVCGEMAGDVMNLPLLVGLGVDEVSMSAPSIEKVKARLAGLDAGKCRAVVERAMACESAEGVEEVLREFEREAASAGVHGPLHEELVLIDLDVGTREEAIQEMVGALHAVGRTDDPRAVEGAVWVRENKGVTGLGYGFAIPHGMTDATVCQSITFARFKSPIEWGSTDGEPVRMALMLTVRESDASQSHLKLLAKLARKLMHEEFREGLVGARDARGVLKVLEEGLGLGGG